MMPEKLNQRLLQDIANFLKPHMIYTDNRESLIHEAFIDCEVLFHLPSYSSSNANDFVTKLLISLDEFGDCVKQQHSIEQLLKTLKYRVGTEKQAKIDQFIAQLNRMDYKWVRVNDNYYISKYPVTNAQYQEFIDDRYNFADTLKQYDSWDEKPDYWDNYDYNSPDQPVVGISWFASIAFCHWLTKKLNNEIKLPTLQEWQNAFQGEDRDRIYPWGKNWDGTKCNNSVKSRSHKPTPVTKYEGKGDSPLGVVDMCGNVEEWCLSEYTKSKRLVCGGSWLDKQKEDFSCHNCVGINPSAQRKVTGFRIVWKPST